MKADKEVGNNMLTMSWGSSGLRTSYAVIRQVNGILVSRRGG